VNGNRIQIQQVLVNLFMNSFQAMKSLAIENRQLHVKSAFHKKKIYVWIEDNGTGIEPEKIDQIFEPLATWKTGGTGMGLAISKSIIDSHGGKMRAENRDEGGARVGFTLPVLKEDKQK
jgi:signal transduction histidine kinase